MLSKLCVAGSNASIAAKCFATTSINYKIPFKSRFSMLDPKLVPTEYKFDKDLLFKMYREMIEIRRSETIVDQLYKEKLTKGSCLLQDGQEAVCVGVENSCDTHNDPCSQTHRIRGFAKSRGISWEKVFGECMGKLEGANRGHGASFRYYSGENHFVSHAIVGSSAPLGIGMAFALKFTGNKGKNVCFAYYGDGAANQGQWWEATNMAKLWNLPVVLICENNRYSYGTCIKDVSANRDFYNRGQSHLIPGFEADGLDCLNMYAAAKFAKQYVLENGPLIIEAHTYRYHGHSMNDPGTTYRSREEVMDIRKNKDCILKLQKTMIANKVATKQELKKVEQDVKKYMNKALETAKKMQKPPIAERFNLCFQNNEKFYIRAAVLSDSQYPAGEPGPY